MVSSSSNNNELQQGQREELRAYTGPPLLIVRSGQPAVQAWAPEYTGMRHVQAAARARRRATRHGIRHELCNMQPHQPTTHESSGWDVSLCRMHGS